MRKSYHPRSVLLLAAMLVAVAPFASAAESDLSTDIMFDPDPVAPGETTTGTIMYANAGPDAAETAYINAFLPIFSFTQDAYDNLQASAVGTDTNGNNPLLFIEDNYCYHYLFQLQRDDDDQDANPIASLPAGGDGQFSFDLPIPMDGLTAPAFKVEMNGEMETWFPYGFTLETLLNATQYKRYAMGADCEVACDPLTACAGARLWEFEETTAEIALADDGSGDYTACDTVTSDVAGKIAFIRRGACEFGQKAFNAEQAGAVMAVIVNNGACGDFPASDDCVLNMGGGALGALVTIPMIQLSTTDGEDVIAAAEAGTVMGTFGNVVVDQYPVDAYPFISGNMDSDPDETNDESSYLLNIEAGTVMDPPVAAFSWTPTTPTEGEMVQFTDESTNNPTSWSWDFGGLGTSDMQNPTFTFDAAGTYTVSLIVTNDGGNDTISHDVTVESGTGPTLDQLYFYPAAARAEGAEGSFFFTDAEINNAGTDAATYQFLWLPADTDNSTPTASDMFTLAAGSSVRYEDVLGSVFGVTDDVNAVGGLAVLTDSMDLLLFERIYNQSATGTFGQAMPGFYQMDLIPENTRQRILFFTQNDDYRSNIGFINGVGMPITVRWERFTADGTSIDTGSADLAPWSWTQINRVFADVAPVEAAYIDVWTDTAGGYFMAYGSVLDQVTSDPTTVLPQ